jgi:hypothetical protein
LLGDKPDVIVIANAPRLGVCQDGFVDRGWRRGWPSFFAFAVSGSGVLGVIFHPLRPMDAKVQKLGGKRFLDMLGISVVELVLFRRPPVRPFLHVLIV